MNVAGQSPQPAFAKAVSNQKTNRRNAQPDDYQNFSQFVQSVQDGAQDLGSQRNCFRQRENFAQNVAAQDASAGIIHGVNGEMLTFAGGGGQRQRQGRKPP